MSREEEEASRGQLAREVAGAREARRVGKLRHAVLALDRAVALLGPLDASGARGLADEGVRLGLALEERGAPLAALSEFYRAADLAPRHTQANEGVARGLAAYASWRPPMTAIGPRDQLLAGATGAFRIGRDLRARVLAWKGGITSETIAPARSALQRASDDVLWLAIDMRELHYVGSTGIAAAVKAAQALEARGGGIVCFQLAPNLGVVIDTLGLTKHLQVAPDLAAALEIARPRKGSSIESRAAGSRSDEDDDLALD